MSQVLAYEMSGKVVRFRTDSGIESIKIDVRYEEQGKIKNTTKTNSNGQYKFDIPKDILHVFITYEDTNYATAGRYWVDNDSDPKTLDTIGLYDFEEGEPDVVAAVSVAWGAGDYVGVGGSKEIAQMSIDSARELIPEFSTIVSARPELILYLEMNGLEWQ